MVSVEHTADTNNTDGKTKEDEERTNERPKSQDRKEKRANRRMKRNCDEKNDPKSEANEDTWNEEHRGNASKQTKLNMRPNFTTYELTNGKTI